MLIIDRHGRVLWRYGPATGRSARSHPSLALALPGALVAVNDDFRHRVLLISLRAKSIVWQYGLTGVAGAARGLLNTPDGMDFLPASVLGQRSGFARSASRECLVAMRAGATNRGA